MAVKMAGPGPGGGAFPLTKLTLLRFVSPKLERFALWSSNFSWWMLTVVVFKDFGFDISNDTFADIDHKSFIDTLHHLLQRHKVMIFLHKFVYNLAYILI